MCLYIIDDGKRSRQCNPIAKIATEDIPVFKVITLNDTSLYERFQYRPNTLYTGKPLKISRWLTIEEGFHAYLYQKFYATGYVAGCNKIVKFTIPKGAEYFLGDNDDIVSDRICSGDLQHVWLFELRKLNYNE